MFLHLFIPTDLVGWRYCLKNPRSFLKVGFWREHADRIVAAQIEDRRRCDEVLHEALAKMARASDIAAENERLKAKITQMSGGKP